MREIFKDIKGYEGLYQVSNWGRVKSINYKRTGKEEIRKVQTNRFGYQSVSLWKDNKQKQFTVHRLVWTTFNGPVPIGYEINHMDENPSNNRLDNLNLLTHKENMNWGTLKERMSKTKKGTILSEETKAKIAKSLIGKLVNHQGISKRVLQYTLDDEFVKEYPSTQEAARQTGFSGGSIRDCCRGIRRTHNGFKWKYLKIN